MNKAEKNISKMMAGYGDLFSQMAEIFKSPLVVQQEINKECERLRQAFIENASDHELRRFADPDCKACDGAGLFSDTEGTVENGLHHVSVICDCLGELDDDGLMKYQKEKEAQEELLEVVSDCCSALPLGEIYDGLGLCSQCKDHATFGGDNG